MRIQKEDALLLVIDFQTSLMPAMYNCKHLENKVEILIKCCRVLDIPALVTQQYTKGLGHTLPKLQEALGPHEYIDKTSFSCFGSQEFVQKLKQTNKKDILITGIEAHICVQQTVLDLLNDKYRVFIAADCISSRAEADKLYAEKRMMQAGAVLTTMESIAFELVGDAKNPKRKDISALIK